MLKRFFTIFSISFMSIGLASIMLLVFSFFFISSGRQANLVFAQNDEVVTRTVRLTAVRDNTLYQSATGNVSNGSGDSLFVGNSGSGVARRGVIAFDVEGSLPNDATVLEARLEMSMSRTNDEATAVSISVHSLQKDWGEGASHAPGQEGGGGPAATNDATWLHTFFDTATWDQPGGDFDSSSVATTVVSSIGAYQWESAALTNDVSNWYSNPEANFGWLLLGDEVNNSRAKRFISRENDNVTQRPSLIVTYTIPKPAVEIYLPIIRH